MPNFTTRNKSAEAGNKTSSPITPSSGNVFADLKVRNPDLALLKAELVRRIRELIAEQELSQTQAGELLGLDQPKVSHLVRGQVEGFTLDRLFRLLNALGQQIETTIQPMDPNAPRRKLSVRSH